jgi:hypothetical protein
MSFVTQQIIVIIIICGLLEEEMLKKGFAKYITWNFIARHDSSY